MPLRIAVVIGTRPEAIKLMPLIVAARARPEDFEVLIVRTGQHRGMVDQLMSEFDLEADFDLDVMQPLQNLAHVLSSSVSGLSELMARERPDWVFVQGDTTTTFAGALAAFYNHVPVGHVEAGLRTHNLQAPFPEEANRSLTARIATLHFAPTAKARDNLLAEGIAADAIVVVGNTGIDALRRTLERRAAAGSAVATAIAPPGGRYVLVTIHRRESHGAALLRICDALERLRVRHPDITVWIPMHPSPAVRAPIVERLGRQARVHLTEPLGYGDFVSALDGAAMVLTDSGGIQEECTALGKPVLVLRDETERSEAVDAGVSMIVGTDPGRIAELTSRLLDDADHYRDVARSSTAYGTGHASDLILDALVSRRDRPPA